MYFRTMNPPVAVVSMAVVTGIVDPSKSVESESVVMAIVCDAADARISLSLIRRIKTRTQNILKAIQQFLQRSQTAEVVVVIVIPGISWRSMYKTIQHIVQSDFKSKNNYLLVMRFPEAASLADHFWVFFCSERCQLTICEVIDRVGRIFCNVRFSPSVYR